MYINLTIHEVGQCSMKFFEILTYVGSSLGMLFLMLTFSAKGAPQEAAGAAIAVALAVIPYCITATLQRAEILKNSINN